jgi:hypothetical protein
MMMKYSLPGGRIRYLKEHRWETNTSQNTLKKLLESKERQSTKQGETFGGSELNLTPNMHIAVST